MGGVSNIVDAVDGVNLCFDLSVEDERSELNWEAGCHDADGKTALAFARMRYSDPRGDIGRAERQRQVVSKTVSKAMKPATLLNPMSALRVERAGASAFTVDQDSSVIDVARLVLAFREAQNSGITGVPRLNLWVMRHRREARCCLKIQPHRISSPSFVLGHSQKTTWHRSSHNREAPEAGRRSQLVTRVLYSKIAPPVKEQSGVVAKAPDGKSRKRNGVLKLATRNHLFE